VKWFVRIVVQLKEFKVNAIKVSMKKKSKMGGVEMGEPPAYPSSKKPKNGVRHPGEPKGIKEISPKKQEPIARKEAKKSGQMTPTAVETKRKSRG
jgi:hypothetical protein